MDPQKNLPPLVTDVRMPEPTGEKKPIIVPDLKIHKPHWPWSKKIRLVAGIILFAIVLSAYVFNLMQFKAIIGRNLLFINGELARAKEAIREFRHGEVTNQLTNINSAINAINQRAENLGLVQLANLFSIFSDNLRVLPSALDNLQKFNNLSLEISGQINSLKTSGLGIFQKPNQNPLIANLTAIRNNLHAAKQLLTDLYSQTIRLASLSAQLASAQNKLQEAYPELTKNLDLSENFLDKIIALLKLDTSQHLLLIFQNHSEIRPAGGFIGSYGYLTLNKNGIQEIKIDDIYNADRFLDLKIIPPRPLRHITTDWEARDANWFFDFPTSGKKVADFLEASELLASSSIKFFGAIAINPEVLKTLLTVTGPIPLPNYELTITEENFLPSIQYEVEAGRDKQPGQNPKRILSALIPIILERMTNFSPEQEQLLFRRLQNHLAQKDIMIYFRDWEMQGWLENLGIAGAVANLGNNFFGDYLAVVNANIAGGKTDAFIDQKIILQSALQENGIIENKLTITRTHNGQNEKDWWYRVANKNYLKVFAAPQSRFISVTGNDSPPTIPNQNYVGLGYQPDADVQLIEAGEIWLPASEIWLGQEFGKTTLSAFLNTPAGKTKNLTLQYQSQTKIAPATGATYQFIFEKQSGVNGPFEYSITAPENYYWQESKSPVFIYSTQKPKSREIIRLTLVKD